VTPLRSICALCAALAAGAPALALDAARPDVHDFIEQMHAQYGVEEEWTRGLLEQAVHQTSIVDAISRPAEKTKPWHEYRALFLTEERIAAGAEFWRAHAAELEEISDRYGVEPEVLVGILGVETYYGRITGRYRVLDALATLAFDYPPRGPFFRSELEHFLLLAQKGWFDPLTVLGSYAGAMGMPQFISSSYRNFSVDSDGDGRRDLWTDPADVLASIANYLREHGWTKGEPTIVRARVSGTEAAAVARSDAALTHAVADLAALGVELASAVPADRRAMLLVYAGDDGPEYWVGLTNFYAITRYNRSVMYGLAVHQLGEAIAQRVAAAP
jgi:membrane-bound lytic murein transglycosylase B